MRIAKKVITSLVLAAGLVGLAQPALAEGSFTSSMSGVADGFKSRTWHDNNGDATSTSVRLASCGDRIAEANMDFGSFKVVLQLTRQTPWYEPDENMGQKSYTCPGDKTQSWGRQSAGDYHFAVVEGGHYRDLYVNTVVVKY